MIDVTVEISERSSKKLLSSSFALKMVGQKPANLKVKDITLAEAKDWVGEGGFQSSIGHPEAAERIGKLLGVDVVSSRVDDRLYAGDQVLVNQYIGPRVPEGEEYAPDEKYYTWTLVCVV